MSDEKLVYWIQMTKSDRFVRFINFIFLAIDFEEKKVKTTWH